MGRIVISIILGFFSPIVFIIGAAPFAVHGEASVQAVLAGSIALALYLAVCQFLVARSGGLLFEWPILFAMVAPLLALVLLIAAVEKPSTVLAQGIPMLVAGCIGSLAGALLAKLVSPHAHTAKRQAASHAILRVGAGLLLVVAAILVVVVIPAAAKDTSPDAAPSPAVAGMIVIVVLHVFLAALMLEIVRSGMLSVVSGVFGLIFGGLFLVIASAFMEHGPAMRLAADALFVCGGIDIFVCASSVLAAMWGRGLARAEDTPAM